MKYKTKYRGYQIETAELEDGSVDVSVTKPSRFAPIQKSSGLFGIGEKTATPTTKTFDNHTQATKFAKNAIHNGDLPI